MINGTGARASGSDAEELTINVCTPAGDREAIKLPKGEPTVRVLKEKLADKLSKNSKLIQINIYGDEDALPDKFDLYDGQTLFLLERTPVYSITSLDDAYVLLKQLINNPRLEWFSQTSSFAIDEILLDASGEDRFFLNRCLNIIIQFFAADEFREGMMSSIPDLENVVPEKLLQDHQFSSLFEAAKQAGFKCEISNGNELFDYLKFFIKYATEKNNPLSEGVLSIHHVMDLLKIIMNKDVSDLNYLYKHEDFPNDFPLLCNFDGSRSLEAIPVVKDGFTHIMVHLEAFSPIYLREVKNIDLFCPHASDLLLKMINELFFLERINGMEIYRRDYIRNVSLACFRLFVEKLMFARYHLEELLEDIVARDDKFSNVIHYNLVRFLSVMIEMTVEPRQDLQPGYEISCNYTKYYTDHFGFFIRFQQGVLELQSEHKDKVINLILQSMFSAKQLGLAADFSEKIKESQNEFELSKESKEYLVEYINQLSSNVGSLPDKDLDVISKVIMDLGWDLKDGFEQELNLENPAIQARIIGFLNVLKYMNSASSAPCGVFGSAGGTASGTASGAADGNESNAHESESDTDGNESNEYTTGGACAGNF